MADVYTLDAHTWLWYVTDDPNLSDSVRQLLDTLGVDEGEAVLPAIALAELVYLLRKTNRQIDLDFVLAGVEATDRLLVAPLDMNVVREVAAMPPTLELHDRIIVATARLYGATLITRDAMIQRSGLVETIW